MTPKFYILKDNERQYVTPEPEELRFVKAELKWGMKKGIISLVTEIRTSTVHWYI